MPNIMIKYEFTAECKEPFHIGGAVGKDGEVLIHPIENIPFIQASSLCGVFRSCFLQIFGEEETNQIFGQNDFGSIIRFSDGEFLREYLNLELRPHIKINPETGAVANSNPNGTVFDSGQKFEREYISAGSKFEFCIYTSENIHEKLLTCLQYIEAGMAQFGGQKSNGCGYIHFEKAFCYQYDLSILEDRLAWAEEKKEPTQDLREMLKKISPYHREYHLEIQAKTAGNLLIKAISIGTNENEPDVVPMKNANGDYIIPGSSLKGAIRSHIKYILQKLELPEEILWDFFGKADTETEKGNISHISVYDTILSGMSNEQTRIHLDKFTGGVMYGGLFTEQLVSGTMIMRMDVMGESASLFTALLLFALRDLACGAFTLGSGYQIGRGYIDILAITITDKKGQTALIDIPARQIQDETNIIDSCMRKLKERKQKNVCF